MKNYQCKTLKKVAASQDLFARFKDRRFSVFLQSRLKAAQRGRYSFFASDPFLVLRPQGKASELVDQEGQVVYRDEAPMEVLRSLLNRYAFDGSVNGEIPFQGGAVGFLSYDFGLALERKKTRPGSTALIPDLLFGFYDVVVCLDHKKDEIIIFSSGLPKEGPARLRRADQRLFETQKLIAEVNDKARQVFDAAEDRVSFFESGTLELPGQIRSNFTKEGYIQAVGRAKEYISRGDIYQVNLSQALTAQSPPDDWSLYKRLSQEFPVDFAAFFKTEEFTLISASPEQFLLFDGERVVTRPMKGTRKRSSDGSEDAKLRQELVESKKEKAELLMIVDLERNDLGRVCGYGSVDVNNLRMIEEYKNIFQATAEVQGRLYQDKDRIDLIRACFPGGSITGCPKIRAMEVIEELEPEPRGLYTGSFGYLSFHNTLQMNILIRTFVWTPQRLLFHVGGGIVSDSDPESEFEETLVKAKALIDAI